MKAAIMITKNSPGSSSAIRIKSSVEVALEPSISQGFPRRKFSETPFFLWVQQLSKIKRCIPHPQNNLSPALYVCARRGKKQRGGGEATGGQLRSSPVITGIHQLNPTSGSGIDPGSAPRQPLLLLSEFC